MKRFLIHRLSGFIAVVGFPRLAPLNCSSRRESALISLPGRMSGLMSAATRFIGSPLFRFDLLTGHEPDAVGMVGRVAPCAAQFTPDSPDGAHGVTRPTLGFMASVSEGRVRILAGRDRFILAML